MHDSQTGLEKMEEYQIESQRMKNITSEDTAFVWFVNFEAEHLYSAHPLIETPKQEQQIS